MTTDFRTFGFILNRALERILGDHSVEDREFRIKEIRGILARIPKNLDSFDSDTASTFISGRELLNKKLRQLLKGGVK